MAGKKSATKRQAILESGLDLFLAKGYPGASMDDIAAAAGVSKQTLYIHFKDKESLFADIVLATTNQVDGLVRWIVDEFSGDSRVEDDLLKLATRFLNTLVDPRVLRLRRLVIANADRFPELGRVWYEKGFERVLATVAACFTRWNDRRVLDIHGDAFIAANHFFGTLLWIPINHAMFTGNETPYTAPELDHLATSAVSGFLRAYAPKSHRG